MLELPSVDPTNPIVLADWLELSALIAADRDSSRGDLEGALRVAGLGEISNDEQVEAAILNVFTELETRAAAAGAAYPFRIEGGILRLKSSWKDYTAYCFCLLLSYFGLPEKKTAPILFQELSCLAAKNYLKGRVVGFGFPRKELPRKFSEAVSALCTLLGEGGQFKKEQRVLFRKDDTLDLVAWVDFVDRLPSKIIMFGQCAAGKNWEEKISELDAEAFCKLWMLNPPISTVLRSFFVPHRINSVRWEFYALKTGVLFDRYRIAHWAQSSANDLAIHAEWAEKRLKDVVAA